MGQSSRGTELYLLNLFIKLPPKTRNRTANRHLDNKHGHHSSVNQLLWALKLLSLYTYTNFKSKL
jgi:hypothetical protein